MFFNARPAKGAPFVEGTDISTIHLFICVIEPEAVALDAEEGRIICSPVCPEMFTFVACEKLGLRIGPPPRPISSL